MKKMESKDSNNSEESRGSNMDESKAGIPAEIPGCVS